MVNVRRCCVVSHDMFRGVPNIFNFVGEILQSHFRVTARDKWVNQNKNCSMYDSHSIASLQIERLTPSVRVEYVTATFSVAVFDVPRL